MTRRCLAAAFFLWCASLFSRQPAAAAQTIDWQLNAAAIRTSCDDAIATLRRRATEIATPPSLGDARTFESVVRAFEDAQADLRDTTVAQRFLASVARDAPVRDASTDCRNAQADALAQIMADPALFHAVAAAARSNTARTVYDRKLTELLLASFRRSGANLDPNRRAAFVALQSRLDELQSDFARNLAMDATTIAITSAQARGVPDDIRASYTKTRTGYVVPVNESTLAFLRYAADETARKAYYIAYNTRAASTNVALLQEAIGVRDRLAHLAGYQTWADYRLADKMAASPERVEAFLASLDDATLPHARVEAAELQRLKAEETHDPNAVLHAWDVRHDEYLLKKARYDVDPAQIRPYFPVQHTIDAVLDVYHTLLGVNFERVDPSNAWAPEVIEYRVTDAADGSLLGYTYFDLFPRPGKYGHFANFPVLPARVVASPTRAAYLGYRRPAISVIVGNWPQPGTGEPALLNHDEVVTFFHEFGHDMATLLATAPYETLSTGFRQDFIEAPSQMLENFVWQPEILRKISAHWQTGAPLPDDLIAKLLAARHVDEALDTTTQILYATVDLRYHTMGSHIDTSALWMQTARDVTPIEPVTDVVPQASFGHLMAGYDAGYYAYLWSNLYAQDLFTAFAGGGLENPAVGMRYRTQILAPARTEEPDAEVRAFLGRSMNPAAFYAELGIAPTPQQGGSP